MGNLEIGGWGRGLPFELLLVLQVLGMRDWPLTMHATVAFETQLSRVQPTWKRSFHSLQGMGCVLPDVLINPAS